MIYERLDKGCKAQILAVGDNRILLRAFWPATRRDENRGFRIDRVNRLASNIVEVSKEYFERRYGVAL